MTNLQRATNIIDARGTNLYVCTNLDLVQWVDPMGFYEFPATATTTSGASSPRPTPWAITRSIQLLQLRVPEFRPGHAGQHHLFLLRQRGLAHQRGVS